MTSMEFEAVQTMCLSQLESIGICQNLIQQCAIVINHTFTLLSTFSPSLFHCTCLLEILTDIIRCGVDHKWRPQEVRQPNWYIIT